MIILWRTKRIQSLAVECEDLSGAGPATLWVDVREATGQSVRRDARAAACGRPP
jgi:hypothetical protein